MADGKGSGLFNDVKWLKELIAEHEARIRKAEKHLARHDDVLHELNDDQVMIAKAALVLSDVCARGVQRQMLRSKLRRVSQKRSK